MNAAAAAPKPANGPALRLGPGMGLPLDAVTETFAILAMRGAGKSNTAVVLAEEFYRAGIPWVCLDPKGDWWGIRSAPDGKRPGLSVPIIGGEHGDVPLDASSGHVVADLIVDQRLTAVIDVSEFSRAELTRFAADFAERLYRRNREPLHVFAEEADQIIPQRVMHDAARCVGAWSKLVRLGRTHGLGVTLISQRPAVLNKDVLTQISTLVPMRTTSPQDRKAIEAWVREHDAGADLMASLSSLDNGEGWVWSPHWLHVLQRIRFRRRRTFDSGATPTFGVGIRPAARAADVDLAALKVHLAAAIERAETNDPKALRRRVAELERELDKARASAEVVEVPVEVPVPVVPDGVVAAVGELGEWAAQFAGELDTRITSLATLTASAPARPAATPARAAKPPEEPLSAPRSPSKARSRTERRSGQPGGRTGLGVGGTRPQPQPSAPAPSAGGEGLGRAERRILAVLAQFPAGRTKVQISLLSGYSIKSSSLGNALGALRSVGYATGDAKQTAITPAGQAALGGDWEPVPVGPELLEWWREGAPDDQGKARLGRAERAVLGVIADAWPDPVSRDDVSDRSGYSATSSSLGNALGKLRSLALIEGDRSGFTITADLT